MLDIRPARALDHIDLVRLWHEGRHDAHANLVPPEILAFRTPDHFAIWLKQAPGASYIAMDPDLLGFVSVKGAEIVKLYVAKHARGTGAAQNLLSFAEGVEAYKILHILTSQTSISIGIPDEPPGLTKPKGEPAAETLIRKIHRTAQFIRKS